MNPFEKRELKIGDWSIPPPAGYQSGGLDTVWSLIRFAITLILTLGVIACLFMLLIGGIRMIMSGGDKEGTAKAKGMITAAVVGLILLLMSFFFLSLIQIIFGVNLGVTVAPYSNPTYFPNPKPGQHGGPF